MIVLQKNATKPALVAQSNGSGVAIEAISSSSIGTLPNVALRLNNGHISTTQSGGGFTIGASGPYNFSFGSTGCTDVAGTLKYINGSSNVAAFSTGTINVTFSKSYPSNPVVVISPTSNDWAQTYHYVLSTTSGFSIVFKNNTATAITLITNTDAFSYYVIGIN